MTPNPHLAYVCADPGVPVFGRKGCSIHVQEVIRALRSLGVRVTLIAARLDGTRPPDLLDLTTHPLPCPRDRDPVQRERACQEANSALREAVESAGPFDGVYERYSLWSVAAQEFAREQGVPGLLEVNAPLVEEQAAHRNLFDRPAAEASARRVFRAASVVLPVSEEVAVWVRRWTTPATVVEVVENGVHPGRFHPGPDRPADPARFTVGFVGTLKPWHGLPVLVDAFSRLHQRAPHARLLIVGDGPERAALESQLANRSLGQSFQFTGGVDPGEVPGWLAQMDVTVAPYPSREQFYFSPLKVYEYMAAGRATVASRVGQLAGLIRHEGNGLLCEPGNADDLAAQLIRLEQDPALCQRLGRSGRETIEQSHTWEKVARRILSFVPASLRSTP